MAIWLVLAVVAFLALGMVSSWRDPKNWIADGESGTLRFGAWAEFGAFGTLMAITAMCGLLFLI